MLYGLEFPATALAQKNPSL